MRTEPLLAAFLLTGCVPHLVTDGSGDLGPWERPENGWHYSDTLPPEGVKCEGTRVGERMCDVRLKDQHGDEVSLYQFWGDVILFDISTLWCAPCRALAESTQETIDHFEGERFTYVTIIAQNQEGGAPVKEDAELWAEVYGIDAPVLFDAESNVEAANTAAFPVLLLLDRNMRVHEAIGTADQTVVDEAIENLLNRSR